MDITKHISLHGLSRASICERSGISRTHLCLIEKGERKIGPAKMRDLAEALGVTVHDLRPDLADAFTASKKIEAAQ